ncbi:hypothetical protein [Burkholderia sp. S171]|uniref:hypothetical protein n=1 Tax=Burkholderia sp. S171 TaxID=1641860 RepID=UPI00131CD893|nr:hypothetical protein [Burkholderia sp. S171]
MKIDEIEYAVRAYREIEAIKMHTRINSLGRRQQEKVVIARHMLEFESRVAGFRESLGASDAVEPAQSIAQDEPTTALKPDVKS